MDKHLDTLVNTPNAADRYDRPWRGRVSRLSGDGNSAWVVVAGIAPKHEFGPCDARGTSAGVGDSVLVMFVGGDARDPIIVRRMQATVAEEHEDYATKAYVDSVAAGAVIDPFLLMGS